MLDLRDKGEYFPVWHFQKMSSTKLTDIQTPRDLAEFLGIEYNKHLIYHIYRVPEEKRYLGFEIPKRSGGVRKISAPATHLKSIQERVAEKLEEVYTPQNPAHGFIKTKSIITNADQHISRRYVLNVDLQDFFGTINFGRVRGMLIAHPYKIPEKVATVIAQICCHDNALPQGAPTSPIVSNMVCSRMDGDLRKLAQKYGCRYTRYADDITFSSNKRDFPSEIAACNILTDDIRETIIGYELEGIIKKNGFEINKSKSRLQSRRDRQEVTGLVTNKKRNVNRRFIRTTRAMIYSWITEGSVEATNKHYAKNHSHHVPDFKDRPNIEKIVRGRLEFIRSIRGIGFSAYITMARKYNGLIGTSAKKLAVPSDEFLDLLNQNVFVIQNSPDLTGGTRQGTAFYLEDVAGFVTCHHLLDDDPAITGESKDFWILSPSKQKAYPVVFRAGMGHPMDLAVFDLSDIPAFFADYHGHEPLRLKAPFVSPVNSEVIALVGWPKFSPGDTMAVRKGHVYSTGVRSGIKQLYISEQIIEGNSGGPVLDGNLRVIGIAARGNNSQNAQEVAEHMAVEATHIHDLVKYQKQASG